MVDAFKCLFNCVKFRFPIADLFTEKVGRLFGSLVFANRGEDSDLELPPLLHCRFSIHTVICDLQSATDLASNPSLVTEIVNNIKDIIEEQIGDENSIVNNTEIEHTGEIFIFISKRG